MQKTIYKKIRGKLAKWYQSNARDLPWRNTDDPYLIWISEVMLQQTQVDTVIPYYLNWKNRFPDIQSVVNADEDEILRAWEGLGYYKRARNIQETAVILSQKFNNELPQKAKELEKLPGIGDYISSAICSIAFGSNVPALEANGIRVLSRLFDFHGLASNSKDRTILKEHLTKILSNKNPGVINQAIMDLGALVCLPRIPSCRRCPLRNECSAAAKKNQLELPVRKSKPPKPHYEVVAGIIRKGNKVLIDKRPLDGLLGGMWEFPGGKIERHENHEVAIRRELTEELNVKVRKGELLGVYNHAYTHFSVTVHAYFVEILSGKPRALDVEKIAWVNIDDLNGFPMGKVDRSISDKLASLTYE
jgi:A/G-specific adenine glycosylase